MATSAYWTASEELTLIKFLVAHKAEAGDGGSFKATTFQKAAKHLAPLLECGAAKNVKSCGNKYCVVTHIFRLSMFCLVPDYYEVSKDLSSHLCHSAHLRMDLG